MWEAWCWEGRWREHSSDFHLPPHKHHPCCCLCLSTPGTKAPIRLIILPLRMFPLRDSLGLAAWQQAPREPGGHLLSQCQCYFQGFRLAGKRLLNSPFPRCKEGPIKPSPHRWIKERHYAWYILCGSSLPEGEVWIPWCLPTSLEKHFLLP